MLSHVKPLSCADRRAFYKRSCEKQYVSVQLVPVRLRMISDEIFELWAQLCIVVVCGRLGVSNLRHT